MSEHENGMPAGEMGKDSGGGMPGGDMNAPEGGEGETPGGVSRFGGGEGVGGQWQPGLVEVQFRREVRPEILSSAAGTSAELRSPSQELDAFNQIVRRHALMGVEPSIRDLPDEGAATAATLAPGADPDAEVPDFSAFVRLQFPPDVDTAGFAAELASLTDVERAVPVPTYLPPTATIAPAEPQAEEIRKIAMPAVLAPAGTPLNEPLVGTSGQLATDPQGQEYQWYIFRCAVNTAWSLASGSNVVVADIDWGYRTTHQDLAPRLEMANAYNSYDGGTNVSFGGAVFHGTGVMGLAGAADNSLGMAGVAYEAALWPVQGNAGPGAALPGDPWANAINWVRTRNSNGRRKVIILEVQTGSYGNIEMVPSINAAIQAAIGAGVVVCVAAGNGDRDASKDDQGNPIPPTGSILVGATAYDPATNPRASFSNWGPNVVVAAPGDGSHDTTCSSNADNAYTNSFGGTSGATPKVAGTAALMLQVNPALTHAQVRTLLNSTGTAVVTEAGKPVGTFLNARAAVQAALPPAWHPFSSLGGTWVYGPAITSRAPGKLDAIVVHPGGSLHHRHYNGSTWGAPVSLGGIGISAPAVVGRPGNLLDVFVIGTNSQLYHKAFSGSWGGYTALGGTCIRGVAATARAANQVDAFVVGTNNAIYHNTRIGVGAWAGFTPIAGTAAYSAPAAVSRGPGLLDVFYLGANNAVFHVAFNGGAWTAPVSLGGVAQRGVAAAWDGTRLRVFTIGMNNRLYERVRIGSTWSGWTGLDGVIPSAPAAVSYGPNRVDALVLGTNSALYWKVFS